MQLENLNQLEQQHGIHFMDLPRDVLFRTQDDCAHMANVLGKDAPTILPPARGVLVSPLNASQEGIMDQVLDTQYAQEAVALQEKMATVPIVENNERMVWLQDVFAGTGIPVVFSSRPYPDVCEEYGGKPRMFAVRESVAPLVVNIARALESVRLQMHIEDGFRPPEVTRGLRVRRFKQFIFPKHPFWKVEQMAIEADSKTANRPRMAGHAAGSAIDYTILDSKGSPLDLGNPYSKGGSSVALKYPYVTADQWRTRVLFAQASQLAGGYIYPFEDWHTNMGDSLAGVNTDGNVISGYTARFGPLRSFDTQTGAVDPYPQSEYDVPFLALDEVEGMLQQHRGQS